MVGRMRVENVIFEFSSMIVRAGLQSIKILELLLARDAC